MGKEASGFGAGFLLRPPGWGGQSGRGSWLSVINIITLMRAAVVANPEPET